SRASTSGSSFWSSRGSSEIAYTIWGECRFRRSRAISLSRSREMSTRYLGSKSAKCARRSVNLRRSLGVETMSLKRARLLGFTKAPMNEYSWYTTDECNVRSEILETRCLREKPTESGCGWCNRSSADGEFNPSCYHEASCNFWHL